EIDQRIAYPNHEKVKRESHGTQQHENDGDEIDQGTVEKADTGVVGREASGGDGGKGVADGIEEAHAGRPICQGAEYRQTQINVPECLGGLGDARSQLVVLDGPGSLGAV